jgi:ribosomal RNA assembly protein
LKQFLKIPKERVGVLIGVKGEIKSQIEAWAGVELDIDSETGDVNIDTAKIKDPAMTLKLVDIVRAISRGFSPERAFRLFDDEFYFDLIDIRDYVGKNQKHVRRMRARLIGTKGKTRKIIEDLTNAELSIYGNTVAIIGDLFELQIAKTAVDMILNGSEHSAVYKYLENKRYDLKIAEMGF